LKWIIFDNLSISTEKLSVTTENYLLHRKLSVATFFALRSPESQLFNDVQLFQRRSNIKIRSDLTFFMDHFLFCQHPFFESKEDQISQEKYRPAKIQKILRKNRDELYHLIGFQLIRKIKIYHQILFT